MGSNLIDDTPGEMVKIKYPLHIALFYAVLTMFEI